MRDESKRRINIKKNQYKIEKEEQRQIDNCLCHRSKDRR